MFLRESDMLISKRLVSAGLLLLSIMSILNSSDSFTIEIVFIKLGAILNENQSESGLFKSDLNSPLSLTLIGLAWASTVTSWIAALWQKRAYQHEVRMECAKNILTIYHEYIRLLKGNPECLT